MTAAPIARRSQSTGERSTIVPPSPAKHATDAKPRFSRYLLVGFAIFQCFLGAGVVFGWTSILPMLEKERIYNELCKPDESCTRHCLHTWRDWSRFLDT
ncbi:hypothetical protein PINS_up002464 [Pythium insidiosum]|nr:hypothetical protein PINS_up002464 [Pythium insidiosum]